MRTKHIRYLHNVSSFSAIFDVHDYEQKPEKFRDNYAGMLEGIVKAAIEE